MAHQQGDEESYRAAARAINESSVDIVNVQHEFGLYGIWRDGIYEDHAVPFLETLEKPVITTLHTVLPKPEPQIREVVRRIAEHSTSVVVMAETAARLLADVTDTHSPSCPHGFRRSSAWTPSSEATFGVDHRTILSTFGLWSAKGEVISRRCPDRAATRTRST